MTDRNELRRLVEALVNPKWERGYPLPNKDTADKFRDEASPEVVLGLLDERDEARKDLDAGREYMRQAWHELNAIRARDGAPEGVCPDYWNDLVNTIGALLIHDKTPWMTGAARVLLSGAEAERDQLREEAKHAMVIVGNVGRELGQTQHERDELRAVAVRLKGALNTSLEKLGLLHQFMCDAHKCDFNEDRTNSWIVYMDHDITKFSHGQAAAILADPDVEKL